MQSHSLNTKIKNLFLKPLEVRSEKIKDEIDTLTKVTKSFEEKDFIRHGNLKKIKSFRIRINKQFVNYSIFFKYYFQ